MGKLSPQELRKGRWLRALEIAEILFEAEGYHTRYLKQIAYSIRERGNGNGKSIAEIKR